MSSFILKRFEFPTCKDHTKNTSNTKESYFFWLEITVCLHAIPEKAIFGVNVTYVTHDTVIANQKKYI